MIIPSLTEIVFALLFCSRITHFTPLAAVGPTAHGKHAGSETGGDGEGLPRD